MNFAIIITSSANILAYILAYILASLVTLNTFARNHATMPV